MLPYSEIEPIYPHASMLQQAGTGYHSSKDLKTKGCSPGQPEQDYSTPQNMPYFEFQWAKDSKIFIGTINTKKKTFPLFITEFIIEPLVGKSDN